MLISNNGHEMIQALSGFREHNNVPISWWFEGEIRENYFGKLCFDKNINVRNIFYKFIFNLMIKMKEKYDYKTLLLSYCLSGLQDENKKCDIYYLHLIIEKIGKLYEIDNDQNIKKEHFIKNKLKK